VRRLPYRRKRERSPPLPWTDCNVKSERGREIEMAARGKMVLGCILGVLICSSNLFTVSQGVWLNLPPTGTKCVSEEIHNNVVVLSDYVVVSDDHSHIPTISVKVTQFFFFLFN